MCFISDLPGAGWAQTWAGQTLNSLPTTQAARKMGVAVENSLKTRGVFRLAADLERIYEHWSELTGAKATSISK